MIPFVFFGSQRLRNLLKHCDPTPEVREVAEQLRDMIAPELLD